MQLEIQLDRENLNPEATQHVDWAGLNWSRWHDLASIRSVTRPYLPGVYRIRHEKYGGLVYIGETGQKKGLAGRRLPALAENVYADKKKRSLRPDPKGEPHTAAPSLVRLCERANNCQIEISYATPQKAEQGIWMQRGIEAGLIALHRLAAGRSPWAFESRPENNDWGQHAPRLPWCDWSDPCSRSWMGLDWTPIEPLSELVRSSIPKFGVYRIWKAEDEKLRYIGEGAIGDRLSSHISKDGKDALFSAAPLPEGANGRNEKHRRDIEIELIGAHVLGIETPPQRQFNRDPEIDSDSESSQTRLF